MKEKENYRT